MTLRMVALVLLALATSVFAQSPLPNHMPTVQVAKFSTLENELNSALSTGDHQHATALLSDDFEEWTPQPPGAPLPRAEWLKTGVHQLAQARILQMAVKTIDDHAIVDFVLLAGGHASFVVDLWQKQGTSWKLQQRYRAPVNPSPYRKPAHPPVQY